VPGGVYVGVYEVGVVGAVLTDTEVVSYVIVVVDVALTTADVLSYVVVGAEVTGTRVVGTITDVVGCSVLVDGGGS